MKINSLILATSMFAVANINAFADTLTGNGSWQSWSTTVLNTATSGNPTGPYWNGASGDGANYNMGWCVAGGGSCQISNAPGAVAYYGNGNSAASSMYFVSGGGPQQVSLLGLFSSQNGVPPSGTDYFGWYSINSSGTSIGPLNQLFSSTQSVGTTATFNPSGNYGFYFENVQSAGTPVAATYSWFSYNSSVLNNAGGTGVIDAGTQHFSIFGGSGTSTYYLGMEDTAAPNSDFDYNDMIVELQPAATVPEPGSVAIVILGFALIGPAVRRGFRK